MSKVTNLNRFRKQRARDTKRREGDENAAKFGRSKAERSLEEARAAQDQRRLDGHRIAQDDDPSDPAATPDPKP